MKIAAASLILLCLFAGARAQNVARPLLELKTDGQLTWAVFSPDGSLLATSYEDKTTVRLWDVRTGQLRAKLTGHDDPVKLDRSPVYIGRTTVAPASSTFSPDGRLLAVTAYAANEIRLWDVQAGKQLLALRGLSDVRRVRFDRSGRLLAIAAGDQGLRLFDVAAGALLNDRWQLKLIKSVDGLWFPPDGQTIALLTTSLDRPKHSLYLVDLATGQVKARGGDKRGHNFIAYASADGRELAAISERGEVSLWDVASGQAKWELKVQRKGYPSVDLAPGARSLAVLNEDQTVGIWDCEKGRLVATLPEKGKVRVVAYTSEGRDFLITVTEQGIRLWDPSTLELRGEMLGARPPMAFSRDGKIAVTAGEGNRAILWEVSGP